MTKVPLVRQYTDVKEMAERDQVIVSSIGAVIANTNICGDVLGQFVAPDPGSISSPIIFEHEAFPSRSSVQRTGKRAAAILRAVPWSVAVVWLAGCSSPNFINVAQPDPGAIGVGLTETLQIVEQTGDDQCGLTLCPHDPIDHHFAATVIAGSSISVAPVMNTSGPDGGTGVTGYAALRVTGLSEGPSTIEITGDDIITAHFDVTVAAIGSSSLVMRYTDKPASVASPFEVISTPPSYIDVKPSYFDNAATPLAGGAVGTVSDSALSVVCSGGRCVIGDPTCTGKCDCASSTCSYDISIGSELGTATFSVPGASAQLGSVGVDAIHDFTISVPDPIKIGGVSTFELNPTDVNGHPIFGAGGSPSVVSADQSICNATIARDQNDRPQITLYAASSGSTMITVSWGPITKSYSVMQ